MTPVHFGPRSRLLFGMYHPGAVHGGPAQPAVLLCSPFGQEGLQSHRFFRVLAERLSRAGHAVLRFDFFGAGDSMGDDADGDIEGWQSDLVEAHRVLMERSGASMAVWCGLGLGATLAAQVAAKDSADLLRLILWDPIVNGAEYLDELRHRHALTYEQAYALPPTPRPTAVVAADPQSFLSEALGIEISQRLREQLQSLRLDAVMARLPVSTLLLHDVAEATASRTLKASGWASDGVTFVAPTNRVDWLIATPENGTLVPTQLLMQLVDCISSPAGSP